MTASTRLWSLVAGGNPSLVKIRATWVSTVLGVRNSLPPMAGFEERRVIWRIAQPFHDLGAILAGVCLVAAKAVWTTPFWLLGYALFWAWLVALCVILLRRTKPGETEV